MFKKMRLILLLSFLTIFINQAIAQTFAVIGDYGKAGANELAVANLVKSWNPEFIVTVGDNNYMDGEANTIDANIGKYYHEFIKPYTGSYGEGSTDVNRFFPVPGNHDWDSQAGLQPYLDYFELYNNERYYDFVWGNIHFFMIDSDDREPDDNDENSIQANWIKDKMLNSTEVWKIVVLHHTPYSSTGSSTSHRWPFKLWGANAVLTGHKHNYERLIADDLVYFVNGLGGDSRQSFKTIIPESVFRYKSDYGAMLVDATPTDLNFYFYNVSNNLIDSYTITNPFPVELTYFIGKFNGKEIEIDWETATEVNNYGFNIERSLNNSENWNIIAFVEGNGNSNSPKYYSYTDDDISISGKYNYRLKQIDNDGTFEYSDIISVEVDVPNNFYLSQNYPNPFNPETKIDLTLPEKRLVSLRIYNSLGELVGELVNEEREAGSYSVIFNASRLTSGIYIYRLQTLSFSANKKMTLIK